MAKEIRLPQLGETMEEATIVNCMVKVGDEVKKGEVIFEIETDKATLEMESPAGGFVKHIVAEPEKTLLVGQVLMVLGDKDEQVPQSFIDMVKSAAPPLQKPSTPPPPYTKTQIKHAESGGRIPASSRAGKTAKDLGVDLADIAGRGPAVKITDQDVKGAAQVKTAKPTAAGIEPKLGVTVPVGRLQKITAERMVKSKREIPCFYLSVKADVTDLVELRTKINKAGDVETSYNDYIIKAVANGLEEFPIMTGQVEGDVIKLAEAVNVGLAVEAPNGLIVPVVKQANEKDLRQIAARSKDLIEKARNEKLLLTDLEGACITVSNLGAFGIDSFIPIVIPGQCTILGVGRIVDTCVPDTGGVAVRNTMNITLAVDHKVVNGAYAARFLDTVRKLLEDTSTFT